MTEEELRAEELLLLKEEIMGWRIMFANYYAGSALYYDDGEMQDNRTPPFIDFKRDSLYEIKQKIAIRTRTVLEGQT